jgi:hypothetical protein
VRVIQDIKMKQDFDIVIADKGFRGTCVNYVNDVLGKIIHIENRIGKHIRNVVMPVLD